MDKIKLPNDHYASNLLFSFDALIDLDIGMLKFFKLNFENSKFIDKDIINNNDIQFFQALLQERLNKNPLSIFIKNEYVDQINNLYDEVYDKNQFKIILLSPYLSFARILLHTSDLSYLTNTILCKNQKEEQYCNKAFPKAKTILRSDKNFLLDNYDAIYLKDIDDLSLMKRKVNNVYLYNYSFNMEKGINNLPKLETYGKMLSSLKLHLASPYSDYIKPI